MSAMRFVTAVQERETGGDEQVEQVSRELWRRIWSEDKDITQPESMSEVTAFFYFFIFCLGCISLKNEFRNFYSCLMF